LHSGRLEDWRRDEVIPMLRLYYWRLENCQPRKELPVITYHNFGMMKEISTLPNVGVVRHEESSGNATHQVRHV